MRYGGDLGTRIASKVLTAKISTALFSESSLINQLTANILEEVRDKNHQKKLSSFTVLLFGINVFFGRKTLFYASLKKYFQQLLLTLIN